MLVHCTLFAVLLLILKEASTGSRKLPELGRINSFWSEMFFPGLRGMTVTVIAMLPLISYGFYGPPLFEVVEPSGGYSDFDDYSTDGTREILRDLSSKSEGAFRYIEHEKNQGKGAAVRTGHQVGSSGRLRVRTDWHPCHRLHAGGTTTRRHGHGSCQHRIQSSPRPR